MDKLAELHSRLRLVCGLLDGAASMIRDVPLSPTNAHILSIGSALSSVFEIQQAIYRLRPELEVAYEEPSPEVSAANRRLGEALIAAYDLADASRVADAVTFLEEYAAVEMSEVHRGLALAEISRMRSSYES
ncbi:MAG: hypothetical protein V4757_13930 [Pseudomonadota bacterium]